jgi:mRNA-degrading endonuclease YafQ of YafQ-DinJ toxin-antitoxin module
MIEVAQSTKFQRAYDSLIKGKPQLKKAFARKLVLFMSDPYHPSLGTHKLGGKLSDVWAFSLTFSLRVTFSFVSDQKVILENIGPHDAVY